MKHLVRRQMNPLAKSHSFWTAVKQPNIQKTISLVYWVSIAVWRFKREPYSKRSSSQVEGATTNNQLIIVHVFFKENCLPPEGDLIW